MSLAAANIVRLHRSRKGPAGTSTVVPGLVQPVDRRVLLGVVAVQLEQRRSARDLVEGALLLDLDDLGRQRAHGREQRRRRDGGRALAAHALGAAARADRDLAVGGGQRDQALVGLDEHVLEDRSRAARGAEGGRELELLQEGIAGGRAVSWRRSSQGVLENY
jgi:hypothetical protein